MKRLLVIALIALLVSTTASAAITKIQLLVGTGLASSFVNSTGIQTISGTNGGAYIFTDEGGATPSFFGFTYMSTTFTGCDDLSSGGIAAADFDGGSWTATIYDPCDTSNNILFSISGTVDWYEEEEKTSNGVEGRGIITITGTTVGDYWTRDNRGGAAWDSSNGKSGITTTITGASQDGDLKDYATDWSSNNVILFIHADSSAIPEPATLGLLGLGALAFRRKRKRS